MPILQPTIDSAETATFNDAFAAIGNAVVAVENVRQIKTYKWADNAARTAQTGMVAGDEGYQTDTDANYHYTGSVWSPWVTGGTVGTITPASGYTLDGGRTKLHRTQDGVVTFQIGVSGSGSIPNYATVANIPAGFRPPVEYNSGAISNGSASASGLIIYGSGEVIVSLGTSTGTSIFRAAGTWSV